MLYPARCKRITVDQSKVLKNRLFRFVGATRYSYANTRGILNVDNPTNFASATIPTMGITISGAKEMGLGT